MRSITFGIALTILGVMIVAHTGSSLVMPKRIIDVRSVKIIMVGALAVQWTPIVGLLLLIGGICVVVLAKRTSSKLGF